MRLEAVTVWVDYADFLAHAIAFNQPHFDRWVVTAPRDRRTRDLCEYHHVECRATDAFWADGAEFAKSHGINVGLKALSCADRVVHLDADIVLPPRTRALLERIELDPACLY